MRYVVHKSKLAGEVVVPSSKSHTLRALLFGALAKGTTVVRQALASPDAEAMAAGCRALGAVVTQIGDSYHIDGVGGAPRPALWPIHAGNSGIALRFLAATAALASGPTVLQGDRSCCERPCQPLISALRQLGALALSTRGNGKAPLVVQGPLAPGVARLDGADSQPVSALLIACSLLEGASELFVEHAGELPWIDVTLGWLRRLGASIAHDDYGHYRIAGKARFQAFEYDVPADFSSAAFPLVAAFVTEGQAILPCLDFQDSQGDKELFVLLQRMGAPIEISPGRVKVQGAFKPHGGSVDVNPFIDNLPLLAVLGCFGTAPLTLYNGRVARQKECDRICCMREELAKMGARIEEKPDGMVVYPSLLRGTRVSSCGDHRVAMALAVAGMGAQGVTTVDDVECVSKSFPGFAEAMTRAGASICVEK